jgi:O-antigen ligase
MSSAAFSLQRIPASRQWWLGAGLVLLLAGSILTGDGSLIGLYAIIGLAVGIYIVRDPSFSLFAFIVINVVLIVRPHSGENGAPSILELLMGVWMALMMAYWLLKIRVLEAEQLSHSLGQLLMLGFLIWSAFITSYGIVVDDNPFYTGLRELLNLTPLLILPILFQKFIRSGSREELAIFIALFFCCIVLIILNALNVKNNVSTAVYVWETGRGKFDVSLSLFLVLVATASLMQAQSFSRVVFGFVLLGIGAVGVAITMKRSLYITSLLGIPAIIYLGNPIERKRALKRLFSLAIIAISSLFVLVHSSRLIRLLLSLYQSRFSSSKNLTTDHSLTNRYSEWHGVISAIWHSPILGHGFGSSFRYFNVLGRYHVIEGFTHNSYLFLLFKTGIIGAILFMASYMAFVFKGFRLLRRVELSDRHRILLRASLVYLCVFLIFAYVEPALDSKTDLIWIGLIWGYILALEKSLRKIDFSKSFFSLPMT